MNKDRNIAPRRSETKDADLESWQFFLDFKDYNLKQEFSFMYLKLLHAIKENDMEKIGKICEKTLYREFNQGLEWMGPQVNKIELMNEPCLDPFDDSDFKVSIKDYYTTFGAFIDRETNRQNGIRAAELRFGKNRPNFRTYTPSDKTDMGFMTMNLQLLVEIETNVKLNLIDHEGKSMIQEPLDKEVHLVLFETVTDRYDLGLKVFKQLFNKFWRPTLQFEEWKIVDFDHCLGGNPHTEFEEKE